MNQTDTHQLAAPNAYQIHTGLSIFDDGTFTGIMRVAKAMAASPLVPESLRTKTVDGKTVDLAPEQIEANCFLVTEQAQRWGISPFAALACASNVRGRMMWEGKLVAGVLEANLGVRLNYEYEGSGENLSVTVTGTLPGEDKPRTIKGNVKDWKTGQWTGSAYEQRLAYRGAREWARRHAPAVMLGVVTEDEELPTMREARGSVVSTIGETQVENPFTPPPSKVKQETAPATSPAPATASQQEEPQQPAPEASDEATEPAKAKRSAKERISRDAKFRSISKKEGNGKTFWVLAVLINGKHVEFTTFSSTHAENLAWLDVNTPIRVTVVQGSKPDQFVLDSYEVITPEGNLI